MLVFVKNKIFSLFTIVKMNANYAEICRVGNFEADFQQVTLVQFFWNFHKYCCETKIQIQQRKVKNIFFDKYSKISLFHRKLHRSDHFLAVNLILGQILENKTQKQKRQMVIKYGQSEQNFFI